MDSKVTDMGGWIGEKNMSSSDEDTDLEADL